MSVQGRGDGTPGTEREITNEMVEAGAIGLWRVYRAQRGKVTSNPKLTPKAILQGRRVNGWDEVAIKDWYRRRARAVLEAALSEQAVDYDC